MDAKTAVLRLERALIGTCARDREFASRAFAVFENHDFSSEAHRALFPLMRKAWEDHRELLDDVVLSAMLESTVFDDDRREQYESAFEAARDEATASPITGLELIKTLAKVSILRGGAWNVFQAIDAADASDDKALAKALDHLDKTQLRLRQVEMMARKKGWISALEDRALRRTEEQDSKFRVPLPGAALKKATNGGLPPGRVVLMMATTNVGKSTISSAFAIYALMHSQDVCVVHIVLEELVEDAENRVDAAFLGVDRSRFATTEEGDRVTDEEWALLHDRYMQKFSHMETQFSLHSIPRYSPVSMIFGFVAEMRKENPGKMILCVVDSPDHLVSGKNLEKRHDIEQVWGRIDAAARDPMYYPLSFALTTHAKKEAEGRIALNKDAAEGYDKSRISHLSLSFDDKGPINAADDCTTNKFEFAIIKSRLGKLKNIIIDMEVDLGTCAIKQVGNYRFMSDEGDE